MYLLKYSNKRDNLSRAIKRRYQGNSVIQVNNGLLKKKKNWKHKNGIDGRPMVI